MVLKINGCKNCPFQDTNKQLCKCGLTGKYISSRIVMDDNDYPDECLLLKENATVILDPKRNY